MTDVTAVPGTPEETRLPERPRVGSDAGVVSVKLEAGVTFVCAIASSIASVPVALKIIRPEMLSGADADDQLERRRSSG